MAILGLVGGSQLLMSSSTHAAIASGCYSYTVRPGDTLSSIGAAHNTSIHALAQTNRIGNVNLIYAGRSLCIPTSGGSSAVRQAPAHSYLATSSNGGSVVSMIQQVFGPYAGSAMRVAQCESSLNPGATNSQAIGNSHAAGVFQILYPSTWSGTPYAGASPYDAWSNINAAHAIFVRDGYSWREWQCQP